MNLLNLNITLRNTKQNTETQDYRKTNKKPMTFLKASPSFFW